MLAHGSEGSVGLATNKQVENFDVAGIPSRLVADEGLRRRNSGLRPGDVTAHLQRASPACVRKGKTGIRSDGAIESGGCARVMCQHKIATFDVSISRVR